MHRILCLALACSLVMLASGCGDGSDVTRAGSPDAPASPDSSATVTPEVPITPPSDGAQKVRVVGQVTEVGDCVVVRDDNDITWTITGDLAGDLVLHDRVQVTGTPDLAATGCGGPVVRARSVTVVPPVE